MVSSNLGLTRNERFASGVRKTLVVLGQVFTVDIVEIKQVGGIILQP